MQGDSKQSSRSGGFHFECKKDIPSSARGKSHIMVQVYKVNEIVAVLIWIDLMKDVAEPAAQSYDRGVVKNERFEKRKALRESSLRVRGRIYWASIKRLSGSVRYLDIHLRIMVINLKWIQSSAFFFKNILMLYVVTT